MSLSSVCITKIEDALGGVITIEDFENEMASISDAIQMAREQGRDINDAALNVSNDLIRSAQTNAVLKKRNAYRAKLIDQEARAQIEAGYGKFKGKKAIFNSVRSVLVGMNTLFKGAQRSADGMAQAYSAEFHSALISRLEKADALPTFKHGMKGKFEEQVAVGIKHLNTKDAEGLAPRVVGSDAEYRQAMKIAEIVTDLHEATRLRLNKAGTDIPKMSGFIGHQTHDAIKLRRAGFDKWAENIRGKLDWEKMKIPDARKDAFLRSSYNAMRSGVRKEMGPSPLAEGFKGPANLARSLSHSRLFQFKEAKDWLEYNRDFGAGDLKQSITMDITMSGKNIGILERMTTNPEAFLDKLIDDVAKKYRDTDLDAVEYLEANRKALHNDLDNVTGAVNIGAHTTTARVGEWWRAIKTMAALGGSFLSALSDVLFVAGARMYQGRTIPQAWGDAFVAPLMTMGNKERRNVAHMLGVGFEGQIGSFMSRFSADDYMHGETAGLLNKFFKLNLLGPWTDSVKAGVTLMLSNDMARTASKSFDTLAPDHKKLLTLYDIDAKQWDVIRAAANKAEDGNMHILPGDIEDVRGAVFNGMSKRQQTDLKDKARNNLFLMYTNESNYAAPTPGAREQSLMKGGSTPDTAFGQARRMMFQFKAFPITAMTKPMGRAAYGTGEFKPVNMQMVNLMVGSFLLGAGILQLKELAKGREPRDWSDPDFLFSAFLQGGAAGLYGDFLLAKHSEYGGSLTGTILGPIPADVDMIVNAAQNALLEGDTSELGRSAVRLLKGNTPGANLFYTKMATDYLIWHQLQELVNPGYTQRLEKRLRDEGREYYDLPLFGTPASTVKYGGGFNQ